MLKNKQNPESLGRGATAGTVTPRISRGKQAPAVAVKEFPADATIFQHTILTI